MSWQSALRILCVRLDAIGDVLMTTPAIRALKGANERQITLLTSKSGAGVAELIPEIDETIVFESAWMKATVERGNANHDLEMLERLRAGKFNAAVIFTVYSQNPLPAALFCYLADIPLRLAHCRENPYQLLTDWVKEPEPEEFTRHEARRQLDLVKAIGFETQNEKYSIEIPNRAQQRVQEILRQSKIENDKWLIMHSGATAPSRRYSPEQFARAAQILTQQHDFKIFLTGARDEIEIVRRIQTLTNNPNLISLAGELNLEELAALIEFAPLLISNNSSPVHIAGATGTPTVDLYALTNPQHTPWQIPHRVLNHDVPCKYCYKSICPLAHHNCLRLVTPEIVVKAALELWHETKDHNTSRLNQLYK